MKRALALLAMFVTLLLLAQTATGQYTKILDFTGSGGAYIGWHPQTGGLLSDGTYLYGVTAGNGSDSYGNIFKIKIADGTFTNLYNFKKEDGYFPYGTPVSDGVYLYGMTTTGGLYGNGAVYRLKISDNSFAVLHHFNGADGARGKAALIIDGGYLYGMTERGGLYDVGKVFKIKIADNSFVSLHDFNVEDGYMPSGALTSDGTYLYGITWDGGLNDDGTIFKIKISDNSFAVMHDFNWDDGAYSTSSLTIHGTDLYGMAVDGGPNDYGIIFKIKTADNSFTNLYEFNGTDGNNPYGSLVSDGTYLYAMTTYGGTTDKGTIFKMKMADNSLTKLYDFSGTDGDRPSGSLTIVGANLYGVTKYGGTNNGGVVFKYQYTAIHPDVNGILYVDSSASPGGDGTSWAKAVTDLSDALHYARSYAASWADDSLRIYVAKGTYLPKYRADDSTLAVGDKNAAFVMVKNVQLYGGFPSGGGSRNWAENPTVLSGDIGQANDAADNAYHVVISAGGIGNARLDGFTITGGNATGSGTITVNGQTIQVIAGGGINTVSSDPILKNLVISGNTAQSGGGLYNNASNFHMINVRISQNTAMTSGGGIRVFNCVLPVLTNVSISQNTASTGGGIACVGSHMHAYNTILFGNSAGSGKNIFNSSQGPTFQFCLMEGSGFWNSGWGINGGNNLITTTNPFVDPDNRNYQLFVSSVAINGGSNQFYTETGGNLVEDNDLAGNDRVYHRTAGGIIDIGAYELQTGPVHPDLQGVLYVDSAAAAGGDGSSWATAIPQLSDALKAAEQINKAQPGSVKQIWMAKGTYYPLYYPQYTPASQMTDRDKTFMLVPNVTLFGGFKGTEATLMDRSVLTGSGTTLSGDIGALGDNTDNTYHVVSAVHEGPGGASFKLNNLTITGGNADVNNTAPIKGWNVFRNQGAGVEAYHANIVLLNCLLVDNSAAEGGAIMAAFGDSSSAVINCTLYNNKDGAAKAIYSYQPDSAFLIKNSVVMDGIRYVGLQPEVTYSLVQALAANAASHTLDGNSDPQFVDAANGDFRLAAGSPAIDAGNGAINIESVDLSNNPRSVGAEIDLGAYEYQNNAIHPDASGILYVDSTAAVGGDGSSWQKALPELSVALHYAKQNEADWANSELHIYVAKGTYLPEYRADDGARAIDDRRDAFVTIKNVVVLGGFPSGGGQRNAPANPTILSGDIGVANSMDDNAYHVVIMAGDIGTGIFDGFTLTKGNANYNGTLKVNGDDILSNSGGGLYNHSYGSYAEITNLKISGNHALYGGGFYNSVSDYAFSGCTVSGNTAALDGGGIYSTTDVLFLNLLISGNRAGGSGGGIANYANYGYLLNVTMSGNEASVSGGGIFNPSSNTLIDNSILFGNTAVTGKNIFNGSIMAEINHSLIEGNGSWVNEYGTDDGGNLISKTSPFVDASSANYQLNSLSHAINGGSNELYTDDGYDLESKDLAGNPRVYNLNSGGIIDMGAYEFQGTAALPVKISPLSAVLDKNNQVMLFWHTYAEINNKGFQVQYGTDGIHFENGLFQLSKALNGNSTVPLDYKVGAGLLTGIKYYRLKQIDLNDNVSYSNIIRLEGVDPGFSIKAYPNPAHGFINIHLEGVLSPNGHVIILDLAGRVLKHQGITEADSKIDLSGLAAGIYILKYADGAHYSTIKIIKR